MADRTCVRCKKVFELPCRLRSHLARKRPCDPIVDVQEGAAGLPCKYCGRRFTTPQALSRHIKHRCKIANSSDGMDRLLEHTLQKQNAELAAKVDRLATLVERMSAMQLAPASPDGRQGAPVTANVQINNTTAQTIIQIRPWDGGHRIAVSATDVARAFAENTLLQEYASWGDHELADPEKAPQYVTELLMDLVKRGHADPAARNVYINPLRADQVLVHMKSGTWVVTSLAEATRQMFDGVVEAIHRIAGSYAELRALPVEAQNALAMAGMLYEEEPEAYVKRAKTPMAAHLSNTGPALCASQ